MKYNNSDYQKDVDKMCAKSNDISSHRESSSERRSRLRHNRIDTKRLTELAVEYSTNKLKNPEYQMSNELGEYIMAITEKEISKWNFNSYSLNWKEDMKQRAFWHLLKYLPNNFNPEKSKEQNGRPSGAYSYFRLIISRAFIQTIVAKKKYTSKNILLNDSYGYDQHEMESSRNKLNNSECIFPDETCMDYRSNL